jgi:hypothetical protein
MKVTFNIDEIPQKVLDKCREAGVSDDAIIEWYEDAYELAIGEGRDTDFDDDEMANHIIECVSE